MSAVVDGPGSVPAGERVLWRGSPDADRLFRRRLSSLVGGTVGQLAGLVLFLLTAGVIANLGVTLYLMAGFVLVIGVVPAVIQLSQVRRAARESAYLITEQRLLIDGRGGHRDLRLVNLLDLRLELQGDGYGSVLFTQPAGAGPERYRQRLSRWVPQLDQASELLVCIPEAARVMEILRKAQADALASTGGILRASATASSASPAAPLPPSEAPVAPQPFMQSLGAFASDVPVWFAAIFLLGGLGFAGLGLRLVFAGLPAWLFVAVGGFFASIGGAMMWARSRRLRERRRMQQVGVRVTARVVDVAATGDRARRRRGNRWPALPPETRSTFSTTRPIPRTAPFQRFPRAEPAPACGVRGRPRLAACPDRYSRDASERTDGPIPVRCHARDESCVARRVTPARFDAQGE
jgi:hypothetical protein